MAAPVRGSNVAAGCVGASTNDNMLKVEKVARPASRPPNGFPAKSCTANCGTTMENEPPAGSASLTGNITLVPDTTAPVKLTATGDCPPTMWTAALVSTCTASLKVNCRVGLGLAADSPLGTTVAADTVIVGPVQSLLTIAKTYGGVAGSATTEFGVAATSLKASAAIEISTLPAAAAEHTSVCCRGSIRVAATAVAPSSCSEASVSGRML
mmetsp:Transcript_3927/g.8745  ORF Transcript_3927/g.8745 Transcript_3927/m.8745 type:complete len:211 (-) Transcript_3927:3180-3812(-)